MLYAIIASDVANSLEKRLAARPAHIERLQQLKAEGRVVLAGPHPAIDSNDPGEAGFSGSLIVHGRVQAVGSSNVMSQISSSDPTRVMCSVTLKALETRPPPFAPTPGALSLKLVVSTTSVLPSQ